MAPPLWYWYLIPHSTCHVKCLWPLRPVCLVPACPPPPANLEAGPLISVRAPRRTLITGGMFSISTFYQEKVPNPKVWQIHFLPEFSAAQCDSGKCVHLPKCVQSHLAKPHGRKQNSKFFSLNSFKTHHVETHDRVCRHPKAFHKEFNQRQFWEKLIHQSYNK